MLVYYSIQFTEKGPLPLQPSSADFWLKPHPLINEFSLVTAHSQWLPVQIEKKASLSEMEARQGQKTVF